ncbi:hypothetical protein N0B40_09245 [Chryseobacterium oranimense]|uniref:hypothetical protein n=1 Tax=Chryseobacterium oranimense TaxID=421058 RepID=UPI0021AE57AF|nr:hypothetical protein [Chryseobacterium oranimense]UWX62465.1 hypothetical protein N0B40_09245 [Chryseobacterium oranimense]
MKINNIVKLLVFSGLIVSCTPAHTLFVKNNTGERTEFFVELKEKNTAEDLLICKELVPDEKLDHKPFMEYSKEGKCYRQKITSVSKTSYKFNLPEHYTVNIAPNNSVYPFKNIYYFIGDKKCFVNVENGPECRQKVNKLPSLVSITEILE